MAKPMLPLDRLAIDAAALADHLAATIRQQVGQTLRKTGVVVAMSGGVDSSVCAGLAVAAMGPHRVLGLGLPDRDSSPESLQLARDWARSLGADFLVEDISGTLDACGCYRRRDAALERLTTFGKGWTSKLVLEGGVDGTSMPVCYAVVRSPEGEEKKVRLPARELREIVAATNFKQRVRTMMAYYHADRLGYAVMGTPNRLEYDLGFFVKGGDGLADLKPIARLPKTQVYRLAEQLGVHPAIRDRPPTTDTYSMPQSQEEFFFSLPLETLDLLLLARDEDRAPEETAADLGLTPEQVSNAFADIDRKRRTARYLHEPALLAELPAKGGR